MHRALLRMILLITLALLLQGASGFMIESTVYNLCVQDFPGNGTPKLRHCDLFSDLQQWFWKKENVLVNKGTMRCLSAHQANPVVTVPCTSSFDLRWHCLDYKLISQNGSLQLATDGKDLSLSAESKPSKWRSLGEGDICQEKLRFRRTSDKPADLEMKDPEFQQEDLEDESMTKEERAYLQWYYRTEDPTAWKYAMLVMSSGALLLGCVLLAKGAMANRNRNEVARYRETSRVVKEEELQGMTMVKQGSGASSQDSPLGPKPPPGSLTTGKPNPGDTAVECQDRKEDL